MRRRQPPLQLLLLLVLPLAGAWPGPSSSTTASSSASTSTSSSGTSSASSFSTSSSSAGRRPRAALGAFGSYGVNLDDLELLAQIADGPVDDGKLTCFTCNNVTDNDECNKYAIDRPCEPGLSLCRTDHVIERVPVPASGVHHGSSSSGNAVGGGSSSTRPRSVRITKSCVSADECSRANVGCRGVAGDSTYLRVCTSCCDWTYCNELAPADSLTAVLAVSRSAAAPSGQPLPLLLLLVPSLAWLALAAVASSLSSSSSSSSSSAVCF